MNHLMRTWDRWWCSFCKNEFDGSQIRVWKNREDPRNDWEEVDVDQVLMRVGRRNREIRRARKEMNM